MAPWQRPVDGAALIVPVEATVRLMDQDEPDWDDKRPVSRNGEAGSWWDALGASAAAALMDSARHRNDAHLQRLQAVETKAGTLLGFAAVVAGLLIRGGESQQASGFAVVATVCAVAAAVVSAAVAVLSAARFQWPKPRQTLDFVADMSPGQHWNWVLEDEVDRGESNHRKLLRREAFLRLAALLLALALVLATVGWLAGMGL